jgi:MscS family membrane protein
MKRARAIAIVWLALALVLVTVGQARAQVARPGPLPGVPLAAPSASALPRLVEDEAADSPRASMRAFLELCDRARYDEAARYLDLPRGADKRGAELAKKLHDVLDQRLLVDPERLSPLALGNKNDALPAGTEELGKIPDAKGHLVPVRIVRHESRTADDEPRWVFSQATVIAIDGLYGSLNGRWVREHLPAPLLAEGPLSLSYWQWIAIPLLAAGCIAIGRLLRALAELVVQRLAKQRPWGPHLLVRLRRPVTMGLGLALFWGLLPYLALTLRAEDLVERVLRALGWLAFFWGLLRAVTVAGDEIAEAKWSSARTNIRSVTGVGVRLGKVVVGALALMVALSELGYPVTTVIAGLGIGGVVLALAAQKTVENLFGSVSILADRPFGVGDTIRVDTVEGTVETIGLRSTRLRTIDRTLVVFPNGKLADMRIESLGARERLRFAVKLGLARDTRPEQIEAILAKLRAVLRGHASLRTDEVSVALIGLGESSFDVELAAPIETLDMALFAKVREELLLACIRVVEAEGARLAVPARQVLAPIAQGTPPGST